MKNGAWKIKAKTFLYIFVMLVVMGSYAQARQITDMVGRVVDIPDHPTRVFSPSPPAMNMIYTIDPYVLVGRSNIIRSDAERDMLLPHMSQIPTVGSLTDNETLLVNLEVLASLKPDLIVMMIIDNGLSYNTAVEERAREALDRLGVPYIYVVAPTLKEYPAAYALLGQALNKPKRAKILADYIEDTLTTANKVLAQVPANRRPGVYYAEGVDGLSTENAESFHTRLLQIAGDLNVHRKNLSPIDNKGYEKLSLEQIIAYNPDFILAFDKVFYNQVYTNPAWRNIQAVKNKKVLYIPRGPWNWFDRPPAFMGAIGLKWLLANFYPQHYQIDIVAEAVNFYHLFLWSNITYDDMKKIVYPNNLYPGN